MAQGAAKNNADALASKSTSDDNRNGRREQARARLAQIKQGALWRSFQRALDLDLAERTPDTRIIRTLVHRAWRNAYLDRGVA
ncbi:MAG: hypothetical protein O7A62_02135 [Alphaproteobacteria bacterium]|nr:hypothetical protein [Alphaproteobacteria bacterium]